MSLQPLTVNIFLFTAMALILKSYFYCFYKDVSEFLLLLLNLNSDTSDILSFLLNSFMASEARSASRLSLKITMAITNTLLEPFSVLNPGRRNHQ